MNHKWLMYQFSWRILVKSQFDLFNPDWTKFRFSRFSLKFVIFAARNFIKTKKRYNRQSPVANPLIFFIFFFMKKHEKPPSFNYIVFSFLNLILKFWTLIYRLFSRLLESAAHVRVTWLTWWVVVGVYFIFLRSVMSHSD